MKVFASLGPPYIMLQVTNVDERLTVDEIVEAVNLYCQEGAEHLGISQKILKNSIVFNVLVSIPTIIIGFFVLRKKMWARKLFIFLLTIFILQPVIVDPYNFKSTFRVLKIDTIFYLMLIWFFQRKSTIDIFIEQSR